MDELNYTCEPLYVTIPDFPHYRIYRDGSLWADWRKAGKWYKLNPALDKDGYFKAILYQGIHNGGRKRHIRLHSVVLECFIGPCPEGMEVCHNNGIKTDNQLDNLRWDTHQSNINDRTNHGTAARGSRSGVSKLKENDIPTILDLIRRGDTYESIGKRFGVSAAPISLIAANKTWTHIARDVIPRSPYKLTAEDQKKAVAARIESVRRRIESSPSKN